MSYDKLGPESWNYPIWNCARLWKLGPQTAIYQFSFISKMVLNTKSLGMDWRMNLRTDGRTEPLIKLIKVLEPTLLEIQWLSVSTLFWAAAPKGPMTYALTHMGDFLLLLLLLLLLRPPLFSSEAQILVAGLIFQPEGPNSSLKAQILASRLKSQPQSSNPNLEAHIPTLRLKSRPRSSNPSLEAQIPT